ncbi:MAG TPA: type VI secretion protein ImpB, partial [Bifidobacterium sp.]|nr:type VI secretion protein ImpB [Bifidobacterium sp.]
MAERTYVAIDLKSFYASSECVEHGFPPLSTHLVVADESRTDKTICLAVSPSLKEYGLPGRARLFEVKAKLKEVNATRRRTAPGRTLTGESYDAKALAANPNLAAAVYIAKPRMSHYLNMSAKIYGIYLKYVSAEDIHVYSIDEVFMDVTAYLRAYGKDVVEMTRDIIRDIHAQTGITATAGIGTNLYLAKVAMDIVAKHIQAGENGIRIARLDETSYRRLLWGHRPLTDFWRVGRGYARKLEAQGLMTMG